jgi:outer membrane protein OmpA-like peptidoglycan-associated protein/nitrite reductase/ring-hydroxylating ferredoxin subunit
MIHFLKKNIFLIFLLSAVSFFGQKDSTNVASESAFEQEFNTWAVGAGVSNLIMHGDFRSVGTKDGVNFFNFGTYLYVSKMFNPIIGAEVRLNYSSLGASGQYLSDGYDILYVGEFIGESLHMEGVSYGIEGSFILDLDNLWKRQSKKWNFAAHLGVGYQRYTSKVIVTKTGYIIPEADFSVNNERLTDDHASSLYLSTAVSLKYRLNKKIDFELRPSLNLNNEDHLDAAISPKQNYETFFVTSIGVVYKFGSKDKHAIWYNEEEKLNEQDPFELLDTDDDGVPDLFDKEPDTPEEAEVYGSGIAIDTDKDGLPDYLDKCPVVPGPIENEGCPYPVEVIEEPKPIVVEEPVMEESEKQKIMKQISLLSKAIYFKTASDVLKEESYKPLNEISDIMFEYPQSKYNIEGHTDSRGKSDYNLDLSNRRARSVYNYLTKNGIGDNRLSSKGYGEDKPVRTNETEAGRQYNRRVEINFIDPKSREGRLVYDKDVSFTEEYEVNSESMNEVSAELLQLDTSKLSDVVIDTDGDGVTDLYDQEIDTPLGVKVYGNGVSVDVDGDGIPDHEDDCPFVVGTVENNGCSDLAVEAGLSVSSEDVEAVVSQKFIDTDGDGVIDLYDSELDTPSGVKVYGNGVSVDSDDDGIADYKDDCPFKKGSLEKNGCPELNAENNSTVSVEDVEAAVAGKFLDSDNDGVADVYDTEPDTPSGVKVYGNGVSVDSDDDGLPDYQDNCPFEKGTIEKNGCSDELKDDEIKLTYPIENTDTDKDGVADVYDKEPNTPAGVKVYGNGVSVDSDNDGLPDYQDNCPFEKGTIEKNGCSDELKDDEIKLTYPIENTDTDKDGVADVYDKEANTPAGVKVYGNGVSVDSDDDGIPDYNDECPFRKGVSSKNGCPDVVEEKGSKVSAADVEAAVSGKFIDTDGDGVIDLYDKEPNTSKKSRVYGDGVSIDSDFDGIPDFKDGCPFAKGLANNNGCPIETKESTIAAAPALRGKKDSDGDGVSDAFDKEPNTPPNVKVYANGIAIDSDKDGVPDYKDRCPLSKGTVANNGCPLVEDLDGDGVADNIDLCPSEKGIASNQGCPEQKMTSNVSDQFQVLASQIKFSRSEGHILKSNNLAILSQIADIMNDYKATSFKIEVHTGLKPNLKYNLELSKRRAYAIKKYLTTKGIIDRRLKVSGLGGTNLKYPGNSPGEDAKNNRVEIKVN